MATGVQPTHQFPQGLPGGEPRGRRITGKPGTEVRQGFAGHHRRGQSGRIVSHQILAMFNLTLIVVADGSGEFMELKLTPHCGAASRCCELSWPAENL